MIQVLHRALSVLELLAETTDRRRALNEIAGKLGLNPATCANILKTLVTRGYADQEAPRRGYALGPMVYYLARGGPYCKDLVEIAQPLVFDLAAELEETVLVAVLRRGRRFVLCRAEGNRALQVRSDIILDENVYQTPTGRLLLAQLSPGDLDALLRSRGLPGRAWPAASSKRKLYSALEKIRADGFVIDETHGEIAALACPIRRGVTVTAALGVFLPRARFGGAKRKNIPQAMTAAAERITARLSAGIEERLR